MNLIEDMVEKAQLVQRPAMKSGDTVRVHVKVREGDKERIQVFEGMVIGMHRGGIRASFTVRKVSFGRESSASSRCLADHRQGRGDRSAQVRRAKLNFLRNLRGKAARMKERSARSDRAAPNGIGFALRTRSAGGTCPPARRARSKTASIASATLGWPGSTKSVARAWQGRWLSASSCSIPGARPRPARFQAADARGARTAESPHPARRARLGDRWAEPDEIDTINIHQASLRAMARCVMTLDPLPSAVLVDGFAIPGLPLPQRAIIGGDRQCAAIAAASIVAKVARDRLMESLHDADPRYGFDRHKGYATPEHLAAVSRHGYSPVHRRSFLCRAFHTPTLFDTIE